MSSKTGPLLSRVADSVYWMARYIERAENVARSIGVTLHLQLDLPLEPAGQWQPLIDASGDAESFQQRYGDSRQSSVIAFLVADAENPNSICSSLRGARENARSVRETISSEMWEQVNSMYLQIQTQQAMRDPGRLSELMRDLRFGCHMFQGISESTMSHNEAWHFLSLGRQMERADQTSRILDVKYFILLPSPNSVGTPYDDLHWSAVLRSVSGFEMYRKLYGQISPYNIVEFLVLDREFPRAIHHCIRAAGESLHAITGTPPGSYRYASERLMGLMGAELDFTAVDHIIRHGLHEYLDGLQRKMNGIGDCLVAEFFAGRPLSPQVAAGGVR